MSHEKPTPGPWKASAAGVVSMSAKGANVICEAPIHYLDSAKNWEANSQLIASAPDLQKRLVAVKRMVDDCDLDYVDAYGLLKELKRYLRDSPLNELQEVE